jgi:hypothetical protein
MGQLHVCSFHLPKGQTARGRLVSLQRRAEEEVEHQELSFIWDPVWNLGPWLWLLSVGGGVFVFFHYWELNSEPYAG